MDDAALKIIRRLPDSRLLIFAEQVGAWLAADLNQREDDEPVAAFGDARARALLREAGLLDEPTLHDFQRLVETPALQRVALYDLLKESKLAAEEEIAALATVGAASKMASARPIGWLALAVAAFAWQREYPLYQFDPDSPPDRHSPAGQILTRAAHYLRRQVQRSATEREKLAKQVASRPGDAARSLEELEEDDRPIPPLPPHFRPPIPVRYPEVARETVRVDEGEEPEAAQEVTRGEPLVITEDDLAESDDAPRPEPASEPEPDNAGNNRPVRMPPITISREQVEAPNPPSPLPPSAVIMPTASSESRPGLTMALRQMFRSEEMKTTKLRVVVQEYPDGDGLYGLQVRIRCKGIKSHVAGTTGRDGQFLAELPVRLEEGLTYDVDVTWPRDMDGETERKSITLHADRTEFKLPFYRRLHGESD